MPDAFHADPANWSRGPVKLYFARSDARLWVPKYRPAFGWTINLAHPLAPVFWLAILLLPVIAVLLLR